MLETGGEVAGLRSSAALGTSLVRPGVGSCGANSNETFRQRQDIHRAQLRGRGETEILADKSPQEQLYDTA